MRGLVKIIFFFIVTNIYSQSILNPLKEEYPHNAFIEGWYYYGYLKSDTAINYNWMLFASFQKSIAGRYLVQGLYDINNKKYYYSGLAEKGTPSIPDMHTRMKDFNLSYQKKDTLLLIYDSNTFIKNNDVYITKLKGSNYCFDATFLSISNFSLANGTGLTGLKKPENTCYYFLPHLKVAGKLLINGDSINVSGDFWYEHIWSKMQLNDDIKWNWWSLKLNNKEVYTITLIRNKTSEKIIQLHCTMQDSVGNTHTFDSINCTPVAYWYSEKTKVKYPIEWLIKVPQNNCEIKIKAIDSNCELPVMLTKYMWEGPCEVIVTNTLLQKNIFGIGIQEMVGYK